MTSYLHIIGRMANVMSILSAESDERIALQLKLLWWWTNASIEIEILLSSQQLRPTTTHRELRTVAKSVVYDCLVAACRKDCVVNVYSDVERDWTGRRVVICTDSFTSRRHRCCCCCWWWWWWSSSVTSYVLRIRAELVARYDNTAFYASSLLINKMDMFRLIISLCYGRCVFPGCRACLLAQ